MAEEVNVTAARRFQCLGPECNNCCRGGPRGGLVRLTAKDLANLGSDARRVTLKEQSGEWFLWQSPNEICPLWEEGVGCSVYDRRPAQCSSYPFWGPLLQSDEAWYSEGQQRCPGIGQGPKIKRRALKVLRSGTDQTWMRKNAEATGL